MYAVFYNSGILQYIFVQFKQFVLNYFVYGTTEQGTCSVHPTPTASQTNVVPDGTTRVKFVNNHMDEHTTHTLVQDTHDTIPVRVSCVYGSIYFFHFQLPYSQINPYGTFNKHIICIFQNSKLANLMMLMMLI